MRGDMLEALDCIEREEEAPQSELSILFACLLNEDEWKVIIKVLLVCFLLETLQWDVDLSLLSSELSVQACTGLHWGRVPNVHGKARIQIQAYVAPKPMFFSLHDATSTVYHILELEYALKKNSQTKKKNTSTCVVG